MSSIKSSQTTLPSIEETLNTSKILVNICENQIFALNLTKDQPEGFYKDAFQQSSNAFSNMQKLLPQLKRRCKEWKKRSLTPHQLRDLHETEHAFEKVEKFHAEIMFLMKHFEEHAEEGDFKADLLKFFNKDKESITPDEIEDFIEEVALIGLSLENEIQEPSTNPEELMSEMMGRFQEAIQNLIMEGLDPSIIEATLFTQWLHMAVLSKGKDEQYFVGQVKNSSALMLKMVDKFEELAQSIKDGGPTENLNKLGKALDMLREIYKGLGKKSLSEKEQDAQSFKTLDAVTALLDEFEAAPIKDVESCFLYYWLRFSIINSHAPEDYFQKFERNWPEVFAEISRYAYDLMDQQSHAYDPSKNDPAWL